MYEAGRSNGQPGIVYQSGVGNPGHAIISLPCMYIIITSPQHHHTSSLIYSGIESIGLLNVISIFVVIGIGVDDVFVFINTFKQSARLPNLQGPYHRITHTILEATKATFFTSLTTSVAFLANTMSSVSHNNNNNNNSYITTAILDNNNSYITTAMLDNNNSYSYITTATTAITTTTTAIIICIYKNWPSLYN